MPSALRVDSKVQGIRRPTTSGCRLPLLQGRGKSRTARRLRPAAERVQSCRMRRCSHPSVFDAEMRGVKRRDALDALVDSVDLCKIVFVDDYLQVVEAWREERRIRNRTLRPHSRCCVRHKSHGLLPREGERANFVRYAPVFCSFKSAVGNSYSKDVISLDSMVFGASGFV